MNFGLQMWLEIKVNTGHEQLHFRFVPWEAESAKTKVERDSFALFNETHQGRVFPKGRDAGQNRTQMPSSSGKFRVSRMQRFGPLSSVICSPIPLWPSGSQQCPLTTLARTQPIGGGKISDQEEWKTNLIMKSTFLVSCIQKKETGGHLGKKQRLSVKW